MYAYPPIRQASWPSTPTWHPPAMELDVIYPMPGPYARGKDFTLYGSRAMVPMGGMAMGFYGAEEAAAAATAAAPVPAPAPAPAVVAKAAKAAKAEKAPKVEKGDLQKQVKKLFTKDESGESKAEKIAKRAAQLLGPKPPPPPPAPAIVQAPAPSGMSTGVQIALVGVAAFVVGGGIGYAVGRR